MAPPPDTPTSGLLDEWAWACDDSSGRPGSQGSVLWGKDGHYHSHTPGWNPRDTQPKSWHREHSLSGHCWSQAGTEYTFHNAGIHVPCVTTFWLLHSSPVWQPSNYIQMFLLSTNSKYYAYITQCACTHIHWTSQWADSTCPLSAITFLLLPSLFYYLCFTCVYMHMRVFYTCMHA